MKVKVSHLTDESLKWLIEVQLKKLKYFKSKGYTKDQLYSKFTKVFVDKYY